MDGQTRSSGEEVGWVVLVDQWLYGGTVYTFREEEIAELHELPKKNSARGHGHMFVSSKGNQQK